MLKLSIQVELPIRAFSLSTRDDSDRSGMHTADDLAADELL